MLRCKALLASQVGSQAVELELHLTGDVDMSLDKLLATHNVSSNITLNGIGNFFAQHDIYNCSVALLFFLMNPKTISSRLRERCSECISVSFHQSTRWGSTCRHETH